MAALSVKKETTAEEYVRIEKGRTAFIQLKNAWRLSQKPTFIKIQTFVRVCP